MSAATPGFETDIKPLFNERDHGSMLSRFDLWSYADVNSENADAILQAVSTGSMPCYGQWPSEQVDLLSALGRRRQTGVASSARSSGRLGHRTAQS